MVGAIEFGTPINPAVPEGPSESANQDVVDLLGPNYRTISTHARVSSNIHPPSLEISKMLEDEVILTAILFRSVARIVDPPVTKSERCETPVESQAVTPGGRHLRHPRRRRLIKRGEAGIAAHRSHVRIPWTSLPQTSRWVGSHCFLPALRRSPSYLLSRRYDDPPHGTASRKRRSQ